MGDFLMILCEELYFEITLTGVKSELKKFITCLKSGENSINTFRQGLHRDRNITENERTKPRK